MTSEHCNSRSYDRKMFISGIYHRKHPKKWVVMSKRYFQKFHVTLKFFLFWTSFSHSALGEKIKWKMQYNGKNKILIWASLSEPMHYGKKRFKIGKIWVSNEIFSNTFLTLLSIFIDVFYDKFWFWIFFYTRVVNYSTLKSPKMRFFQSLIKFTI